MVLFFMKKDEREELRKNRVKPAKTKKQNPEYERELELVDKRDI